MNRPTTVCDERNLDLSLQTLVATHGYAKVVERLNSISTRETTDLRIQSEHQANPRYLLTLPPEQRERILSAAAEDALPLYEADLAKPLAKRELTADLETGDLYEDYDASQPTAGVRHA